MHEPGRLGLISGIAISILIGLLLVLFLAFLMRAGFVGASVLDAKTYLFAFSAAALPLNI